MTSLSTSPLFGALFALAASSLTLGFAAGPAQAASVKVAVERHELASVSGRAAVEGRIGRAADRVCGVSKVWMPLSDRASIVACREKAVADARAQLASLGAATQMASR